MNPSSVSVRVKTSTHKKAAELVQIITKNGWDAIGALNPNPPSIAEVIAAAVDALYARKDFRGDPK